MNGLLLYLLVAQDGVIWGTKFLVPWVCDCPQISIDGSHLPMSLQMASLFCVRLSVVRTSWCYSWILMEVTDCLATHLLLITSFSDHFVLSTKLALCPQHWSHLCSTQVQTLAPSVQFGSALCYTISNQVHIERTLIFKM